MSWLCFLGALPASLEALRMGPMVIIQGLCYCAKLDEEYSRTPRDHFLLQHGIYWSYQLLMQRKCVTECFKRLSVIATGDGYAIIIVVQYVLQLILCTYDLILHIYTCLYFSCLWMAQCMICVYVCKFWYILNFIIDFCIFVLVRDHSGLFWGG